MLCRTTDGRARRIFFRYFETLVIIFAIDFVFEVIKIYIGVEYDIGDNIREKDVPNNGPKCEFSREYVCKFHISIADKRYMIFVLNVYNGNK
jgi:hypothetical protein